MTDQEYKGFVIEKLDVRDYYFENPSDRDEHGFERSIFECKREIDLLLLLKAETITTTLDRG